MKGESCKKIRDLLVPIIKTNNKRLRKKELMRSVSWRFTIIAL